MTLRHNDIGNATAKLLTEVCKDVREELHTDLWNV